MLIDIDVLTTAFYTTTYSLYCTIVCKVVNINKIRIPYYNNKERANFLFQI